MKSKKAISEIISFVCVLLIVLTSSITIYIISKEIVDSEIENLDYENMKKNLIELKLILEDLDTFDGSKSTYFLNFRKGKLGFFEDKIEYTSQVPLGEQKSNFCYNDLCYDFSTNYEVIYVNIENVTINTIFTLNPKQYNLEFLYEGGQNEIIVSSK